MAFLSLLGVLALLVWVARLSSRVAVLEAAGVSRASRQAHGERIVAERASPPPPRPVVSTAAAPVVVTEAEPQVTVAETIAPRPEIGSELVSEQPTDAVQLSVEAEIVPDEHPVLTDSTAGALPAVRPASPSKPSLSLESFLGGRVMLVAGVIAVLFGIAFFLKVAIERGYFPPQLRILLGSTAGVSAIWGGDRLRRKDLDVFGQCLMGGGLAALYLCTFFSAVRYEFISEPVAFAVCGFLTAAGVGLSLLRNAPAMAYLGFFGGFLAPAFLGDPSGSIYALASWLVLFDLGIAALLCRRRWAGLDLMAMCASGIYFGIAMLNDTWAASMDAPTVLAVLVLGQLILALLPAILTGRRTLPTSLVTAIATGACAIPMGAFLLYETHPVTLGLGVLGLGLTYVIAAIALPSTHDGESSPEVPIILACGLASLASAVPILLDGPAIPATWAASGVAAVFIGLRSRQGLVQAFGLLLNVLALVSLTFIGYHKGAFAPFLSGTSLGFLWPIVALGASGALMRREEGSSRTLGGLVIGAACWLFVPYLIGELWMYFEIGRDAFGSHWQATRMAVITGALALYSGALAVVAGRLPGSARVLPAVPLALTFGFFVTVLFGNHAPGFTPLLGNSGIAGLLFVGAVVLITRWAPSAVRRGGALAAVVCLLALVSSELFWWGETRELVDTTRRAAQLVAQVWISVTWAITGAALVATGFARRLSDLRWAGLAALFLTVAKVFLMDMAQLDTLYKVGSFLVLGVLLVAASFLYQRARGSMDDGTLDDASTNRE